MSAGRPKNYTDEQVEKLVDLFSKYIDETDIPIIAEFAYKNDITRQMIYDYDEFSTLKEKCINKKESQLEIKGLNNETNTTMTVFSLKQMGWSDNKQIDNAMVDLTAIAALITNDVLIEKPK